MGKMIVSTTKAPEAIGPYSQAIIYDDWVFCSGQVGIDPSGGELVGGGVAEETRQALENLTQVLEAAGTSLVHVAKVTAYLTDMATFAEFNEIYEEFFGSEPPARATVGVAELPKGARVEVECVARL
jgi:2-iminobutanoate/2-iminopropanoate deaminase